MIDRLEQMARNGAKDAARQLLQELQSMLDNLQMAQPGQMQDGDSDDQNRDGVEHGGDDLALDLLGFFHELRKAVQDDFQHTAQLAGLHHVHVEAVEHFRVLRQAF